MKRATLLWAILWAALAAQAQAPDAFERLYTQAINFSKSFPREKAYLHCDNSSYYQGDTIWYKAYVVTEGDNKPSRISKPLYVELLDETGNVIERQIVRLNQGEGCGQIALTNSFITGYYELRAYTKWMLAGDSPTYFSRTFPIYRKRIKPSDPKAIATYHMDASMQQRPKTQLKPLNIRFYPEGGVLVQGVPSQVGIETLSRKDGWVNLTGRLVSATSANLGIVATIHDGMGSFTYTPSDRPSKVVFNYAGKDYEAELPAAQPQGYVLSVINRDDAFEINVTKNALTTERPLAVFVFAQGTPYTYARVQFAGDRAKTIRLVKKGLPAGITRLALIDDKGQCVADRFSFVYPTDAPVLTGSADSAYYRPFTKIKCKLRLTDAHQQPIANQAVSVAVRDGLETEFQTGDADIRTDLLLTSDVKGYVSHPEFYLKPTPNRKRMLDNLLLIRGWRKYDLAESFGTKTFRPKYIPEDRLTLYGKVKSVYGRSSANLGITLLAQKDSIYLTGATVTDSLGMFAIPLDDFYDRMETLIQTRKAGKSINRSSDISLFRNFAPPLRTLDYAETHPTWDQPIDTLRLRAAIDSIAKLPTDPSIHTLAEVVVKAKNRSYGSLEATENFERDLLGVYNIRQFVDQQRDKGKYVANDVGLLMHQINDNINLEGTEYGVHKLQYTVNGHTISQDMLNSDVDEIEMAILYADPDANYTRGFDKNFRAREDEATDLYSGLRTDSIQMTQASKLTVMCDFTMSPRYDPSKNHAQSRGLRKTLVQGYNTPAQFYAPIYTPESYPDDIEDRRRTLYWLPNARTNANGEVDIECYNSRNTTYLNVNAEALVDGKPTALTFFSVPDKKE